MKTTYHFVTLASYLTDYGYNKDYVEAFVGAMNEHDFVQHPTNLDGNGQALPAHTQGWSYGLSPRYNDGRVTTRRTSWVFGRKETAMPEGACAMVYFKTEAEPVGFLVKVTG